MLQKIFTLRFCIYSYSSCPILKWGNQNSNRVSQTTYWRFSSRAVFSCCCTSLASTLEVGVVMGVTAMSELCDGDLVGVGGIFSEIL